MFFLAFAAIAAVEAEQEQPLEVSPPEVIATNCFADDLLVGGFVCPLSGQVRLTRTDLMAPGKEPLLLKRALLSYQVPTTFDTSKDKDRYELVRHAVAYYRGWDAYTQRRLIVVQDDGRLLAKLPLESGIILHFELKKGKEGKLLGKHYGINNFGGTLPSAKYDLRNISCHLSTDGCEIVVDHPDGTRQLYRGTKPGGLLKACTYPLIEETLPNGNKRRYHIGGVTSYDATNTYSYASHNWERHPFHGTLIKASTHTSQQAHYELEIGTAKGAYKDGWYDKGHYEYTLPPILKHVSGPLTSGETCELNSRFQLAYFEGDDQLFRCTYDTTTTLQMVKTLAKPSGLNNAWEVLYTFEYTPAKPGKKEGHTTVRKRDGTYQIFIITKDLLLDSIQQYDSKGKLQWKKKYLWASNQWLSSIEKRWADGTLLSKTSYQYDSKGNPIIEKDEWNGRAKTIRRSYSKDRFNLLLKEEHEEGPSYLYEYLPETNLLTKKTTLDGKKICREYEKHYDMFHNLIKEVETEGSNRNISKITTYQPREQEPFLHLPEWVEEAYLENGKTVPLKKTHLHYDTLGRVCLREIYNANGNFAYTQQYDYDERGNLLSETNPIGQVASYEYDEKGRCIQQHPFSGRLVDGKEYDRTGRVIRQDQIGDHGTTHSESYSYDPYDRKISHIDYLGNTTYYSYDPICNQPQEIIYPPIESGEVIVKNSYDSYGRKISTTDPNGNRTSYSYDGQGNLLSIQSSEGHQKCYRYNFNRKCTSSTDEEGNETLFEYDALGNLTCKKELANSAIWHYSYQGDKRVLEIDPEGFSSLYAYDGAGRLSKKEREGRLKDFEYDSLGFLQSETEHDAANTRKICYTRDFLGREVKREHQDRHGKVFQWFSTFYDEAGNISEKTREIDSQKATQTESFDPFDRLIASSDPYGNRTEIAYIEDYHNHLGQNILKTIEKNPQGTEIERLHDSHGRLVSKKITSKKELLSLHENFYDPCGNTTEEEDYRIVSGKILEKQILKSRYDCENHIIESTRAFGSPSARTTRFTYTPTGNLETKTLHNEVALHYSYDALGRLLSLSSSDQTVDQEFRYDLLGNLLEGKDHRNHFLRTYDPFGNIIKEKFSTGISLEKSYDAFDRPLYIKTDNKQVRYEYDPWFLRSVEEGQDCRFKFTQYDPSGNCLEVQLPLKLEKNRSKYDKNGRVVQITNPRFSESYAYDALGNLIERSGIKYQYDKQCQLTQEGPDRYQHDSLYCDYLEKHNPLNEKATSSYDLNGNVSMHADHELKYDPIGRLIEAVSGNQRIQYHYDVLDRCLFNEVNGKLNEIYLYDGCEDIGTQNPKGELLNFRLTTPAGKTLCIEQLGKKYATLNDLQGSVRRLIPLSPKEQTRPLDYNAFGQLPTASILNPPWMYQGKRYLPELSLYRYAKRLYNPETHTWMTPDPRLNHDSINLYQFCLNNPYSFQDPNGEFVMAIPLIIWGATTFTVSITATEAATALALAATACYVYNNPDVLPNSLALPFFLSLNKNDGTPRSREAQNKQFNDAMNEIGRRRGEPVTRDEQQKIHRHTSGQDYGYHEIVEEGSELIGGS